MKKLISLIIMLLCFGFSANAKLNASENNNKIIIENTKNASYISIAGYDANGKLVGADIIKPENNLFIADKYADAISYRAGIGGEFFDLSIASPTPVPQTSPAATLHPAYEKPKDASQTIAVVKEITSIINDGEDSYKVTALIRGEEKDFIVSTQAPLLAAPDFYKNLEGNNAGQLKMGDIVYIPTGLNGKTKDFALVHRPLKEEIIVSDGDFGANFEKLISTDGIVYGTPRNESGKVIPYGGKMSSSRYNFAFGVITDKYTGGFTLRNRTGLFNNAIDIETTADTIVYVVDEAGKGSAEIAKTSAIFKSAIPKLAFDENENITYSTDYSYNYAFARVVNNIATEVVIYTNSYE